MSGVLHSVDQRTQLAGHNRMELLLFKLQGKQRYGINVFKVQEVIQCPALTRVPQSHYVIRGIANMRGKTIPVMDLSLAIGGDPIENPQASYIIITEYNRSIQGFLVNVVDRIINMNWGDIMPPPSGMGGDNYLTAVTRVDNELVEIIDVEKVLSEVIGGAQEVSEDVLASLAKPDQDNKPHVLVADDSAVARNQVKRTLEQVGLECTVVNDGAQALAKLREWASEGPLSDKVTLMVSDIEMPEMDGYTLTTAIRNDPALKDLYIILHTSLSGVFNNAMIQKVGANEFIPKFKPDELARTVMEAAQRLTNKSMDVPDVHDQE